MAGLSPKSEFPPLLSAGFHVMSVSELRAIAVDGVPESITRRGIMEHLEEIINKLVDAGFECEIWADGSFVTEKIDPNDVDYLLRVSSSLYDADATVRATVDWACDPMLSATHSCDAYKWIEYQKGHPLHSQSEDDRAYWTGWFGGIRKKSPKGIAVIKLPARKP